MRNVTAGNRQQEIINALAYACSRAISALNANDAGNCEAAKECRDALISAGIPNSHWQEVVAAKYRVTGHGAASAPNRSRQSLDTSQGKTMTDPRHLSTHVRAIAVRFLGWKPQTVRTRTTNGTACELDVNANGDLSVWSRSAEYQGSLVSSLADGTCPELLAFGDKLQRAYNESKARDDAFVDACEAREDERLRSMGY